MFDQVPYLLQSTRMYHAPRNNNNIHFIFKFRYKLVRLKELLRNFDDVSKFLQTENSDIVNLHNVRALFDELIVKDSNVTSYLGNNSDIIHNNNFENTVVKIQVEKNNSLTQDEKDSVQIFLKESTDEVQINTTSFVRNTLQAVHLKRLQILNIILRNMYLRLQIYANDYLAVHH
jgi:hypothetical protein